MIRLACAVVPIVFAAVAAPAQAFMFSLTPVTNTTPNFAGTIFIQGTITLGPGETFLSPNVMSSQILPFISGFTAGFNGSGQTWDPGFIAWNGVGSYSGPIYNHLISTNNLGYAGGKSALILHYTDAQGFTQPATAVYAVNVVPAPGAAAVLACCGLVATRRRRSAAA
jgi:hypothetical protein